MQNYTGRFMSALLVDTVNADGNRIESLTQHAKWFQLAIDYLNPVYTIQPVVQPVVQPVASCIRSFKIRKKLPSNRNYAKSAS